MTRNVLVAACCVLAVLAAAPARASTIFPSLPEDALRSQAGAAQPCSPPAESLRSQAARAVRAGDVGTAIAFLERAVQSDPRCVPAYLDLGELYILVERYADAAALMRAARAVGPPRADVVLMLIVALYFAGEYRQVADEAAANRALITADNQMGVLGLYVAFACLRLGDVDAAIEWLDLALRQESAASPAGRSGRFARMIQDELIDLYREILARRFDPRIAVSLATVLHDAEQWDEALAMLDDAAIRAPAYAPTYYWMALVHLGLARGTQVDEFRRYHRGEARRALERYLELAPAGEYADAARRLLAALLAET